MTTRRNMLFGLSGCAGFLAMPIVKVARQSKDLLEVFEEIETLGVEIVKEAIKTKMDQKILSLELTSMISEKLGGLTIENVHLYYADYMTVMGTKTALWTGNVGPAKLYFNFIPKEPPLYMKT